MSEKKGSSEREVFFLIFFAKKIKKNTSLSIGFFTFCLKTNLNIKSV